MDGSDRITALMADMDAHSRANFDDDVALFMKYRNMTPKGIMQLCETQQEEIKIKRDAISRLIATLEEISRCTDTRSGNGDSLVHTMAAVTLKAHGASTKSEE